MENRSPQWAKKAANAAKKRAMNRTVRNQHLDVSHVIYGRNGVVREIPHSVMNKEGRYYRFPEGSMAHDVKKAEQVSGPPMPSAWLPESGYGASPRPTPFTREPPEPSVYGVRANDGNVEYAGTFTRESPEPPVYGVPYNDGSVEYGGRRRTRSRKTRSRKTRRRHR